MLRSLSFSVLVLIAALGACSSQPSKPRRPTKADRAALVAQPAPNFTLEDLTGGTFSLAQAKGKVVFLDFWATWCPPCRMSIPEVKKLSEEYAGKNVEVISISLDENVENVRTFVAENALKHRQLLAGDASVANDYAVRGIPMFVTLDKEGRVAKIWTGFNPAMAQEWRSEINGLLSL